MPPSVSVLIPTFTRTRTLVEAMQSVLQQDYLGDIEILVINDQPRQCLAYDKTTAPNITVRIINCWDVFPSLGVKRHAMLGEARNDWVTFLDDDDLWMPWHLQKLHVLKSQPDVTAIFPVHQFVESLGVWTYGTVPGGINSVFVKTNLARFVGFDPKLNVGEDNAFRNEVERRAGVIARPGGPSNVYRATAPVMHISRSLRGVEVDRSIFLEHAEKLIDTKVEPTGRVELEPAWCIDYVDLVRRLYPETVPTSAQRKKA